MALPSSGQRNCREIRFAEEGLMERRAADPACRRKAVFTEMKLSNPTFTEIMAVLEEGIMANPFCHVELNTTDVKKAKDFYSQLFNWKLEDTPDGSYTMIRVGEGTGGGMMKHPIAGAPSFWLAYVLVEDIQAATKKAKSLGATVMRDVTEIPGFGSFSVIADP